jgi:phosphopantetheine--protein transferase-like protein
MALRVALSLIGQNYSGPILPGGRGAPYLGPEISGSISHKRGLAAAAVHSGGATVGIDVETLEPRRSRIARRVLTPREFDEISLLAEDKRWPAIAVRFSIKEAVYKAVDPWVQDEIGFQDVSVQPLADGAVALSHTLAVGGSPLVIAATWTLIQGVVVALAECRSLHSSIKHDAA